MSKRRRIKYYTIYNSVAGKTDELTFVIVLSMLIHIDKQIVTGCIKSLECMIIIGSGSFSWRWSTMPFPHHNCFSCCSVAVIFVVVDVVVSAMATKDEFKSIYCKRLSWVTCEKG